VLSRSLGGGVNGGCGIGDRSRIGDWSRIGDCSTGRSNRLGASSPLVEAKPHSPQAGEQTAMPPGSACRLTGRGYIGTWRRCGHPAGWGRLTTTRPLVASLSIAGECQCPHQPTQDETQQVSFHRFISMNSIANGERTRSHRLAITVGKSRVCPQGRVNNPSADCNTQTSRSAKPHWMSTTHLCNRVVRRSR
jgi:hypothetical protein